jgi:glycosyltransferase involved in cell wall biosynthesis
MVAFHYPPQINAGGVIRTLKFTRYLPDEGWLPVVLTVKPWVYDQIDHNAVLGTPDAGKIIRAFALDARKHLSVKGRYIRWTALPDRWVSWLVGAIPCGLTAIYRHQIDVIFSTFPIASAILIGYLLHRCTGKPWIVDMRDSMTEDEYPRDPQTRRIYRWIESRAVEHAARILFTAPSAIRMYLERYPNLDPAKCVLIPNGYDEEDFLPLKFPAKQPTPDARVRLLHSGIIYPDDRDPRAFFKALSRLKAESKIGSETLSVDLRACGAEAFFRTITNELGIDDIVHMLPALPHREALQDAADADALLLLQAASCNHQIPGKAYEYLRLNKPILALTPERGDTASLFYEVGGAVIADLGDEKAIYEKLPAFLSSLREGRSSLPEKNQLIRYERKRQAHDLACCLSETIGMIHTKGGYEFTSH